MAVTELHDSRSLTLGKSPRAELRYLVNETNSESTALAALLAGSAATYNGLVRQNYGVEPVGDPTESESWIGTVTYGEADFSQPKETGESSFSFDTGGGTDHATQSISTVASYSAGGSSSVPDYGGAINVEISNGERRVNGVDFVVPQYNFTETHYIAYATVDNTFKGNLFSLTGKVNNATFRGLAAGECLFLGASGSVRGDDEDWEITYRFAGKPNRTGLTVGDITGINVKGWEYLWVQYENKEETVDDKTIIIPYPKYVYVEQIYQTGNFSSLGI